MIRVIIAEDNLYARKAIKEKLSPFPDVVIKDTAQNGREILDVLEKDPSVDVILMDVVMPVMNGIQAVGIIREKYPHVKVVMVTIYDDDDYIFDAIRAGADSYILKESNGQKIYESIRDTLAGGAVMSPSIAVKTLKLLKEKISSGVPDSPGAVELSARETEILMQLSKGLKNKAIAESLFISSFTVKRHIENIYGKLKVHNRVDLLQEARKNKLI